MFRYATRKSIAFDVEWMTQMVHAGQCGAEVLAVTCNTADGNAAESHAVIATFTSNQLGAQSVAAHAVIRQRHLQCGIDRL